MNLQIINPSVKYKESYHSYLNELGDEEKYPYPMDFDHSDFPALIKKLSSYSKGIGLPDWLVTNTTYWLIEGTELIGVSHLRHRLNANLMESGGHIGLGIRPSSRGKGYGNKLLDLTIEKAKKLSIEIIHIHCHKDNKASSRMIKSSGGALIDEVTEEVTNKKILRYIVNTCQL
jgi:predicted acetyltransferase